MYQRRCSFFCGNNRRAILKACFYRNFSLRICDFEVCFFKIGYTLHSWDLMISHLITSSPHNLITASLPPVIEKSVACLIRNELFSLDFKYSIAIQFNLFAKSFYCFLNNYFGCCSTNSCSSQFFNF